MTNSNQQVAKEPSEALRDGQEVWVRGKVTKLTTYPSAAFVHVLLANGQERTFCKDDVRAALQAQPSAEQPDDRVPAYLFECLTCGQKKEVETVAEARELCEKHSKETTVTAGHYTSYKATWLKPGQVFHFPTSAAPAQPVEERGLREPSLTLKQILDVLYKGRTMVNFHHVPWVTRAIDWLNQDFRAALAAPGSTAKEPRDD